MFDSINQGRFSGNTVADLQEQATDLVLENSELIEEDADIADLESEILEEGYEVAFEAYLSEGQEGAMRIEAEVDYMLEETNSARTGWWAKIKAFIAKIVAWVKKAFLKITGQFKEAEAEAPLRSTPLSKKHTGKEQKLIDLSVLDDLDPAKVIEAGSKEKLMKSTKVTKATRDNKKDKRQFKEGATLADAKSRYEDLRKASEVAIRYLDKLQIEAARLGVAIEKDGNEIDAMPSKNRGQIKGSNQNFKKLQGPVAKKGARGNDLKKGPAKMMKRYSAAYRSLSTFSSQVTNELAWIMVVIASASNTEAKENSKNESFDLDALYDREIGFE